MSRKIHDIKAWSHRNYFTILVLSASIFFVGVATSIRELALRLNDLNLLPIILVCGLGVPATIALNAAELQLCARATGRGLGLRRAVAVTATATVSNLLPIPAGFAIRGGALVAAGANLRETGAILITAAFMWLAMALAMTGVVAAVTDPTGLVVAAAGLIGASGLTLWIGYRNGSFIALGFVGVRACLLAILVLRLWLCFAAVGAGIPVYETAYYAVAGIGGTVVMIVPAGLGVSEGLAAAMAEAVGGSPSAAFLALGLNRVLGLLLSGAAMGWLWIRSLKKM